MATPTHRALGVLVSMTLPWTIAGCSSDNEASQPSTAIVAEVDTDYDVPEELDEIVVHVSAEGADGGMQTARGALRRQSDVPISVVLEPAEGVTTVRVLAEGYLDGDLVRQQSRKATFVPDRIRDLPLFLAKACDLSCPDGETCVSSEQGVRCEPEVIDLDPDDGGDVNDASSNDDASIDGGLDGGGDAGDAGECIPSDEICNGLDDDCDQKIDDGDTICPQGVRFGIASCGMTEKGQKGCVIECVPGYLDCPGDGPGCGTEASANNCGCGIQCTGDDPCAPSLTEPGTYECLSAGCAGEGEEPCDGLCVNTQSSAGDCGACGAACPQLPNAIPTCEEGECRLVCLAGYRSCDGYEPGTAGYENGCEVDINTDVEHCGACDGPTAVCPNRESAETICDNGVCGMRCQAGFLNCDDRVTTGCETPIDRENCYQCGNECSDGIGGILAEQCCDGPRDCCTL